MKLAAATTAAAVPLAVGLVGLELGLVLAACSKKEPPAGLAPAAANSMAASTASAPITGAVWHLVIDPKSTTHIDMPGVTEHIVADTTAAAGTLDVVPGDLGRSRGLVRVDLLTLATSTFHNGKDQTQTEHARTWLEVTMDGKTNEALRWADYAVRSLDGLSATDLAKVASTRDGVDDVRKVTAVVHGDLLVHRHRVPKDDAVEVTFRYPAGTEAGAEPTKVEIRSTRPMRVLLKEHTIEPRDPAGQVAAWTARLISKVAETADVTVQLTAVPTL